jgi:hypothetical protein
MMKSPSRFSGRGALLLAIFSLAACGPKLTDAHLAKVDLGMKAEQVEHLLGKPDDTHEEHVLGFTGTTLTYHAKAGDVKVVLINDQVISINGHIDSN